MARKNRVAKIFITDILREKGRVTCQIIIDNRLHALCAQRELPVTGHNVNAEEF